MRIADQDSDSMYVTDQKDIVKHAASCYIKYPTIVNNIPKDTKKYNNTMYDYAVMDSTLAGSQKDIGESSNLAQLAQSYSASLGNKKYDDYVAILSIVAQISIDSSKRRFDIDIPSEISRIKNDMDIKNNGYPKFWKSIKKDFNKDKINNALHCPMDYLQDIRIGNTNSKKDSLLINEFLVENSSKTSYRKSRKVEELIADYSLNQYKSSTLEYAATGEYDWDTWLVLRSDFDKLIEQIRLLSLSVNYRDLIMRLIKRAFVTEPQLLRNKKKLNNRISKNKSVLLKALYDSNPKVFLTCFIRKQCKTQ